MSKSSWSAMDTRVVESRPLTRYETTSKAKFARLIENGVAFGSAMESKRREHEHDVWNIYTQCTTLARTPVCFHDFVAYLNCCYYYYYYYYCSCLAEMR
jgi:hypothetical protein